MNIAVLVIAPLMAIAQQDPAVERALIERDRQSAEFSRPELRDYHELRDRQHLPMRPDERQAEERDRNAQRLAIEPAKNTPAFYPPLPLPGGPVHGVDPIPAQGGRS